MWCETGDLDLAKRWETGDLDLARRSGPRLGLRQVLLYRPLSPSSKALHICLCPRRWSPLKAPDVGSHPFITGTTAAAIAHVQFPACNIMHRRCLLCSNTQS